MNTKTIITIAALALTAACAKDPRNIAAVQMQGNFDCATERAELGRLEQSQRSARAGDIFWSIMIGIPVSSLSGADLETEIAVQKGRVAACREG